MTSRDHAGAEVEPAAGDEVLVFADEFGILVQGPTNATRAVIDQLLGPDLQPAESRSSVSLQGASDVAALAAAGVAVAATAGEYLRLTPASLAKVQQFGEQLDSGGALRGYVRDGGKFAGQLSFEPVSLAAEQALALQTAAVSLALRSAIANVQQTVDEVKDKVESIKIALDSRLLGDVIGTYRDLDRVVSATNERGRLLQADWQGTASTRSQIYRDLEALRAKVSMLADALSMDLSVPKRAGKLEEYARERGNLADMLQLILVAEQSLHLYEYLRLQQVRLQEPDHVASAVSDARASLTQQQELDEQLVETVRAAIERVRRVDEFEIHHILSKGDLDEAARSLHAAVAAFAEASRLNRLPDLDDMPVATVADTRDEVRDRAVILGRATRALGRTAAEGGSQILRRGGKRLRAGLRRSEAASESDAEGMEEE